MAEPTLATPLVLSSSSHPLPAPPQRSFHLSYSSVRVSRSLSSNEMTSILIEDSPQFIEPFYYQTSIMNDNYLIISIILTLLSVLFGCIPALCCSIPAIIFAARARRAFTLGHYNVMRAREKTAFALNIFVLLFWIISFTIVVTVTYRVKCGEEGIYCNTSPYRINHQIYND